MLIIRVSDEKYGFLYSIFVYSSFSPLLFVLILCIFFFRDFSVKSFISIHWLAGIEEARKRNYRPGKKCPMLLTD